MKKVCIIIPVHNEAREIGRLVHDIRAQGLDVLVIDDGSTDDSGRQAADNGARVLRNDQRSGKGFSLQRGFAFGVEQGYDGVITMDGDGQHAVRDLRQFFDLLEKEGPCVITGNRMGDTNRMPCIRFLTNCLMSFLISRLCRQKVPDTQCGYRYISCEILRKLELTSSDFEIETEVLVQTARLGYRIFPVPVQTIYQDEQSKISPLKDTCRFFAYLAKEIKKPVKPVRPPSE